MGKWKFRTEAKIKRGERKMEIENSGSIDEQIEEKINNFYRGLDKDKEVIRCIPGKAWKVKDKEPAVTCSLVGTDLKVYIEAVPRRKIELLMKEYPNQEWMSYMVGQVTERGTIWVTDLIIPPHKEARAASAEAEPLCAPKECLGVLHSHHHMGAFHSGTDQSYVDKNYPVSITVAFDKKSDALEYDVVSYGKTPCGRETIVKGTVIYIKPEPLFDEKAWLKESKGNVDKGKVTSVRNVADYSIRGYTNGYSKGYQSGFDKETGIITQFKPDDNGAAYGD
jgi:hypothetical protein